jgi:hypothetical protein
MHPTENTARIIKEARLLVRYLAMDVLLSRARVLGECVYRAVAYQSVYKSQYVIRALKDVTLTFLFLFVDYI